MTENNTSKYSVVADDGDENILWIHTEERSYELRPEGVMVWFGGFETDETAPSDIVEAFENR